jgi:hypothetical protein
MRTFPDRSHLYYKNIFSVINQMYELFVLLASRLVVRSLFFALNRALMELQHALVGMHACTKTQNIPD